MNRNLCKKKITTRINMKKKAILYLKKLGLKIGKESQKKIHTTTDNKIEIYSSSNSKKFHQLFINNIKQQSKKDKTILMKKKQTQLWWLRQRSHATNIRICNCIIWYKIYQLWNSRCEFEWSENFKYSNPEILRRYWKQQIEYWRYISPRREMEQYQQNIHDSILYNNATPLHPDETLNHINEFKKELESEGYSKDFSALASWLSRTL